MAESKRKSTNSAVLALDIGTSSVRVIAFDIAGAPLLKSQIKYGQNVSRGGGVETDAEGLLSLTVRCLEDILRKAKPADIKITGVGVSCFWHSLIGVGADNLAVTPVYSWADTRSADMVQHLEQIFDRKRYHGLTGCELHSCFWPAKLLLLRSAHSSATKSVHQWMGFGEYLMLRLFGKPDCSLSMASGTGLFDQHKAEWAKSVLETLAIDRSQLPEITTFQPTSGIKHEFRQKLTELRELPWFPAVGDGACSNIGSGGFDSHRMVLNIGTSAALRTVAPAPAGHDLTISPGLFCYRVDSSNVVVGGAFANGGNVYAWLKQQFQWIDDDAFLAKVAKFKPGSHGLIVLPFWAGERSPNWRPNAEASIIGMNLNTSAPEIVRASLEACAFSYNAVRILLADHFPQVSEIVISGGAVANDPLFAQIVCDVFGKPLKASAVAEASSLGAAMLAMQALGQVQDFSQFKIPFARTYRPNMSHYAIYADAATRWQEYSDKLIK